jgi:hypothetical protein
MPRWLRTRRPNHATVVAYLALFVALGGTSYAALRITGKQVKDSSLTGRDVKNESLTGRDVRRLTLRDFATPLPAGPKGDTGPPGKQGDPGPGAVNLSLNQAPDEGTIPIHQLPSVGPWSLSYYCYRMSVATVFELYVDGPTGEFQSLSATSTNGAAPVLASSGGGIGVGTGFALVGSASAANPDFKRLALTVQLHAASGAAGTLSASFLVDARDTAARRCSGSGTGIPTG